MADSITKRPPDQRLKLFERSVLTKVASDKNSDLVQGLSYETLLDGLELLQTELEVFLRAIFAIFVSSY